MLFRGVFGVQSQLGSATFSSKLMISLLMINALSDDLAPFTSAQCPYHQLGCGEMTVGLGGYDYKFQTVLKFIIFRISSPLTAII